MNANEKQTTNLAAGQILKVTAPPGATGLVVRLSRVPGGGEAQSVTVINGANLTFGPYSYPERFDISCTAGSLTYAAGYADITRDSSTEDRIYVSTTGDDTHGLGTADYPFASLTKAFAVVTTSRKKVIIASGEYDEAATVTWPDVNGVELLCPDGTATISSSAAETRLLFIDPAAASGTWSATLNNIELDHGDIIGLQVDNTNVGKRINLYLINFSTGADDGQSINIARSGAATDAIRVYADGQGNTIEGLVSIITESTDDRFRFKGYRLIGGLTIGGVIASEVTLINCGVLTSGLTVDGANKLTNVGCWYETDANPNVYTNFANAFATY